MNPYASPAHIGPVRRVVRYLRNRVAPRVCTMLLNGGAASGLLSAARKLLSLPRFQSVLRFTNWGILFFPDRRYLEKVLMPLTCPPDGATVALIGIHPYTTHYSYFYLNHRVVAFDPDPLMWAYRGRATFLPLPMRELAQALGVASVELVHCNGVYGWGLDEQPELHASLASACEALAPGGMLLLGYDTEHHNPLGWTEQTELPQPGLIELHREEYPISFRHDHVFRVFQKPG